MLGSRALSPSTCRRATSLLNPWMCWLNVHAKIILIFRQHRQKSRRAELWPKQLGGRRCPVLTFLVRWEETDSPGLLKMSSLAATLCELRVAEVLAMHLTNLVSAIFETGV